MTPDDLDPQSFAARDAARHKAVGDLQKMLQDTVASTDRSGKQMQKEVVEVASSPGQLTKLEYVQYRLYELEKKQRKEFISDWLHWQIEAVTGDPKWSAKTVNKAECTQILIDAGIPTIPIVALVDPSGSDDEAIRTVEGLDAFLTNADLPLFAKPNQLLGSFGAFRIDDYVDREVSINRTEKMSIESLFDEAMGGIEYLLAPFIENHQSVAEFSDALATIRTMNFVKNGDVTLVACAFKIPAGDNIADNFWRDGNLLADVDVESGTIRRAVSGVGPYQVEHQVHPQTQAPLIGYQIPFWSEVLELNKRTAELFSTVQYQSLDIAVTPAGPVVVEVNSGGSFSLPQLASGRGFLTKQNRAFFESCGVNFRKLENEFLKAS